MSEDFSIMNLDSPKDQTANCLPWRQIVLLLVLILIIWLPRRFELDRYVATDEVVWLLRSANFYYALGQGDYAATYIKEHPGVVTMWAGTAAYMLEFHEYRGFGQGYFESDKYWMFEDFITSKGVNPHDVLVTTRVIMVIINTLLIAAAFVFARLLFGTFPALIGIILIAFDPFHVSVTRLAHLDSRGEAQLIAMACSQAPAGHDHWTLRLLAGKLVQLEVAEAISYKTVRRTLKKTT